MPLPALLGALGPAFDLIDDLFTSDEERDAAKLKVSKLAQNGELKYLEVAGNIITAEAKSEHPLTSQWRPITMLVFVAIIANNYIVYPYLSLFWEAAPVLELPADMWDLLKIGLGGYVVGRTGEKMVGNWKGGT